MKVKQQLSKEQKHMLLTLRSINCGIMLDLHDNFSLTDLKILQETDWHIYALPAHNKIDDNNSIQKMKSVIGGAISKKRSTMNALKHRRGSRNFVRSMKHIYVENTPCDAEILAEQMYYEDKSQSLPFTNAHITIEQVTLAQAA